MLITFAVVAVTGIAALLASAGAEQRWAAFSPKIPTDGPAATVSAGRQVCDGPMRSTVAFGSVRAWLSPGSTPAASLSMRVRSAAGAIVAIGRPSPATASSAAPTFNLTAPVRAGQAISVCIRGDGPNPVTLLGSKGMVSLLFLRPHPQSLLSLVPTIFRRAALFRPSWVGPWTYWLLLAAVLAAFVAGGFAVAAAIRADEDPAGDAGARPGAA